MSNRALPHGHTAPPPPAPERVFKSAVSSFRASIMVYPAGITTAGSMSTEAVAVTAGGTTYINARPSAPSSIVIRTASVVFGPSNTKQSFLISSGGQFEISENPINSQTLTTVAAFPNERVRNDGLNILRRLHHQIIEWGAFNLPPLQALTPEDGSLWLTWNSRHWRIGFTIETDPAESGWHLISDREHGDLRYSGDLASANIPSIVAWALDNLD
jgi:hypothetical protein